MELPFLHGLLGITYPGQKLGIAFFPLEVMTMYF